VGSAGVSAPSTGSIAPVVAAGVQGAVLTLVAGASSDGSGGAFIAAPVLNQYDDLKLTSGGITITYEVTAVDATRAVDSAIINIAITGTATTGTGTVSGSSGYGPVGPPTSKASRPQFVAGASKTVTVVTICQTYLLFPWVFTIYGTGGTLIGDTGVAIANTTADPPIIGTTAQSGTIGLWFFPITANGSPGTAPTAAVAPPSRIASPLAAGGVAAFNVSELYPASSGGFLGYMIAVCNFQLGHGTGFYSNPSTPGQGAAFQALVVTNPRLTGAVFGVTENTGH